MDTKIIQLDLDDDGISILDRLQSSSPGKVILVFPKHILFAMTRLEMQLVQRAAWKYGVTLALVSQNPRIRKMAHSVKLDLFGSVSAAQSKKMKAIPNNRLVRRRTSGRKKIDDLKTGVRDLRDTDKVYLFRQYLSVMLAFVVVLMLFLEFSPGIGEIW